ncbi:MAG: DNA cytosine methyltransferase [Desulfococcaceae bacterium]
MQFNGIDLFAGAGGLSEGFIQAGFNIIGTIEKDSWACETQRTRHIFHYLKNAEALGDYWNYCKNANSTDIIKEHREKIYRKHPGLREKIENTVWHEAFGQPDKNGRNSSSNQIIELLIKSMKFNKIKKIDFILGGPPCQAYSIVGRNRMKEKVYNDERNFLFKFYYDIVKYFKPVFFLFENVPGIITARKGEIFEMIKKDFSRIKYNFISGYDENGDIRKNIRNARHFGVAQNRKRFIFIGIRKDVILNYPIFDNIDFNNESLVSKKVIDDLPFLAPDAGNDHWFSYYTKVNKELSDYQKELRENSIGIMNHRARSLNKLYDKEIYRRAIQKAEKGEQLDYSELPENLKKHKNKGFKDKFKVHWWNKIPHTVVAHIAKDGHYNIHPDIKQLRSITVREAARIQSFPDNFKFEGPRTAQYTQVGNAVPPKMAKAFAEKLKRQLEQL